MSKIIKPIIGALLIAGIIFSEKTKANNSSITLNSDNTYTLKGPVNAKSVSDAIEGLNELIDKRLLIASPIYLVLDSPGGSISAGLDLIEYLKTQKNIHTISLFAASMAHGIAQANPGKRYVTASSVMMAHRARGGISGQISEGELEQRLKLVKAMVKKLETQNADRIGISLEEYKKKVKDEWWTFGVQSVSENIADELVQVKCTSELIKETRETEVKSLFGSYKIGFSKCPLLRYPRKIEKQ